ncbi:acid protease [Russula emetica]|nr:acid protease [Russula emetica]
MYFTTVFAFTVLPFLVGAVPVSMNSARTQAEGSISIPLSKRGNHLDDDGFVDLEKLQASMHHTMTRFERAFSAYERNTGEPHPLALKRENSNERRTFVPVPLTFIDNNPAWTGDIAVGTPARSFSVVFDTFHPDMFLPGVGCQNCNGSNLYDISLSSTGTSLNVNTSIDFDIGSVTGNVVTDNVFVAGFEVTNEILLVATSVDSAFQSLDFPADGILGLGFNQTSAFGANSFFTTLINQGGLGGADAQPVFGLFLSESDSGSELVIGGTDTSKFMEDLTFINLDSQGFWQIPLDSISVNGNNISVTIMEAILDASSTFVSSDVATIASIYNAIPGSAQISNSPYFTIPCDTNVTISMTFGGNAFDIAPFAYNLGPTSATGNNCMGGFAITNLRVLLGTVFLQNVYTEFDQGNLRVGFSPAILPPQSPNV